MFIPPSLILCNLSQLVCNIAGLISFLTKPLSERVSIFFLILHLHQSYNHVTWLCVYRQCACVKLSMDLLYYPRCFPWLKVWAVSRLLFPIFLIGWFVLLLLSCFCDWRPWLSFSSLPSTLLCVLPWLEVSAVSSPLTTSLNWLSSCRWRSQPSLGSHRPALSGWSFCP